MKWKSTKIPKRSFDPNSFGHGWHRNIPPRIYSINYWSPVSLWNFVLFAPKYWV